MSISFTLVHVSLYSSHTHVYGVCKQYLGLLEVMLLNMASMHAAAGAAAADPVLPWYVPEAGTGVIRWH